MRRYGSLQHYFKVWIQKKQYSSKNVKKTVAISQMVKKDMIEYYGVPEKKITVVPNCVDLERFHPRLSMIFAS